MITIELNDEQLGYLITIVNERYNSIEEFLKATEGEESIRVTLKRIELAVNKSVGNILDRAEM